MSNIRRICSIAVLLSLGCDSKSVRPMPFDDDKRVPGDCFVESATPLPMDAAGPLGFKPADAIAQLEQERSGVPFKYRNQSTTTLTLSFERGGEPVLVEYQQTGNPALDEQCQKRITADGLLRFRTDDDRFDESLQVTVTLESETASTWEITVPESEVRGSFEARGLFDPGQLENAELVEVVFDGAFEGGGVSGEISAHVIQAASDDAVGGSFIVAAAWGDAI